MVAPDSPAEPKMSEIQMAVFANGDGPDRARRDTSQSSNSEDWRNKTANDLLVDLLDPVSKKISNRKKNKISQSAKSKT